MGRQLINHGCREVAAIGCKKLQLTKTFSFSPAGSRFVQQQRSFREYIPEQCSAIETIHERTSKRMPLTVM
jgi:hypothetical protein